MLFWFLCLVAFLSFGTSSLLYWMSAGSAVRFVAALFAMNMTAAVQKFIVLELVVVLLKRKRPTSAVVLETILR